MRLDEMVKLTEFTVLGTKENHKPVACPICGSLVTPHFEPKYNGERALCKKCGINWAES